MHSPTRLELRKLIAVADYQFGRGVGSLLFNSNIKITRSVATGRIRHVYRGRRLIATLRPRDGFLALTTRGAQILLSKSKSSRNVVTVRSDVSSFIEAGGDVFAKHVVSAPRTLRPREETVICNERGRLLAVGRAILSGRDMAYFKRGVAVKVRKGIKED